jgi:hypothetical protein
MFEIKKQVVHWEDKLYVIKRSFRDTGEIPIRACKKYYQADKIARKDGYYFMLEEIKEVEILEEILNTNQNKQLDESDTTLEG